MHNQIWAITAENLAEQLAATQGGRLHACQLLPYLPLSLGLVEAVLDALAQSQAVEKTVTTEGTFYTFLDLLDAKPSTFRVDTCVYSRETLKDAEYGVITDTVRKQIYTELEQLSLTHNWAAQAVNEHELLYLINHLPAPVRPSQVAGHSRLPFKRAEQHLNDFLKQRTLQLDPHTRNLSSPPMRYPQHAYQKNNAFIRQFPAALKEESELNLIHVLKKILFVFLGCICLAVTARVHPIIIILLGFTISTCIYFNHLRRKQPAL